MAQYHHHPDGLVYVRTPSAEYVDTVENFALDAGSIGMPAPSLPPGIAERLYDNAPEGGRHALIDPKGNHIDSGARPWAEGDSAITAVAVLREAQAKRQVPAPSVPAPTAPAPVKGVSEF